MSWGKETVTLEDYGRLLDVAPPSFRFTDELPERALLLRHDIDYRPKWIEPMARMEAERGVVATYCLLVGSPLYSLDTKEAERAVSTLLDGGHELGLHFDSSTVASDGEILERLPGEVAELSERYGVEVRVVSFHRPGTRPVSHISLPPPLLNTYAPRFFTEIGYLSDSNQDWRGKDPHAVLQAAGRIQLLIHPALWSGATMRMILEEQAQRLGTTVDLLATIHQRQVMERQA